MIRKTLTILSLIGLLLSVGLWGASYFRPILRTRHLTIGVTSGRIGVVRYSYGDKGRFDPILSWKHFRGLATRWGPDFEMPIKNVGNGSLFVPLWMPTLLFAGLSYTFVAPVYRRRKRKKLGLCVKCGYDLRASKDRCPECGEGFSK